MGVLNTTKIEDFFDGAPSHVTDYAIPAVWASEKLPRRHGALPLTIRTMRSAKLIHHCHLTSRMFKPIPVAKRSKAWVRGR